MICTTIVRGLINSETLPGSPKTAKLFPNGIFGNNVICSPLIFAGIAQQFSCSLSSPSVGEWGSIQWWEIIGGKRSEIKGAVIKVRERVKNGKLS